MTKAQQIMKLYHGPTSLTTRQIADRVGCLPAYVRVVARQRKGGGSSPIDCRYFSRRYHEDAEFRERKKAIARAHYHANRSA